MKTLFALLGLFMFASVSSTDLTENPTTTSEPALLERGDASAGPKKIKDIASNLESGDASSGPKKIKDLSVTSDSGDASTSPKKIKDLTGDFTS